MRSHAAVPTPTDIPARDSGRAYIIVLLPRGQKTFDHLGIPLPTSDFYKSLGTVRHSPSGETRVRLQFDALKGQTEAVTLPGTRPEEMCMMCSSPSLDACSQQPSPAIANTVAPSFPNAVHRSRLSPAMSPSAGGGEGGGGARWRLHFLLQGGTIGPEKVGTSNCTYCPHTHTGATLHSC